MAQYMPVPGQDLRTLLQEYERALILGALASNRGHQRRAAVALGLLPTTLLEKMRRLGIPGRRGRADRPAAASAQAVPAYWSDAFTLHLTPQTPTSPRRTTE